MMCRSVIRRAAVAASLACVGFAVSRSDGAVLQATADNYVYKASAGTPQTDGTTLTLKEATTLQGNARLAYLRFDVSTLTPAADGNSAIFTAYISDVSSNLGTFTYRVYALNAGVTGFDWSETGITYNNRPAYNNSTNPLVDTSKATVVGGAVTLPASSPIGTPVSIAFADWDLYRQSDNTITLIFLATSQSSANPSQNFASSEYTTNPDLRPTLTITAPEPTTAALLALVTLPLLSHRRRERDRDGSVGA